MNRCVPECLAIQSMVLKIVYQIPRAKFWRDLRASDYDKCLRLKCDDWVRRDVLRLLRELEQSLSRHRQEYRRQPCLEFKRNSY